MSVVVGLDAQQTKLGYGLVDAESGEMVDLGCIVFGDGDDAIDRAISRIHWRAMTHGQTVLVVYLEAPHVGASRRGAVLHAMAVGRAFQAAVQRWPMAPVQLIEPADWKKVVGLPGNARKDAVRLFMEERGVYHDSQDAIDGAAVALAGWSKNTAIVRVAG